MTAIDEDIVIQGPEHQVRYYKYTIAPQSAPTSDDTEVRLASHPPLAQVTILPHGETTITATIAGVRPNWQVALWCNLGKDSKWIELPMSTMPSAICPENVQASQNGATTFSVDVVVDRRFNFTYKYRAGPQGPWKWVQAETGLADGTVIVDRPELTEILSKLSDIVHGLNPAFSVHSRVSQSPGVTVWNLQLDVKGVAVGAESDWTVAPIGTPWGRYIRWFGLARSWEAWLCPVHGWSRIDTDKSVILCSFLNESGVSVVFLAVSGIEDTNTFIKPDYRGGLELHARNDGTQTQKATVIVTACHNVENAIAAAIYEARTLRPYSSSKSDVADVTPPELQEEGLNNVKPMWYENWYDGLGYCTWNSLGQDLTDQKIYNALDELEAANIKISTLIIDDNWQSIDKNGSQPTEYPMTRFEASSKTFPDGLKKTIATIKSKHQNIRHVAVWHALFGYWGGVSPDSEINQKYETLSINRHHRLGGPMHVISPASIRTFYNDFYSFLSSCGVDGVKTDAQFTIDTFEKTQTRRAFTKPYQNAWTLASLRYFGNKVVSCMSQVPQLIFHSQVPRTRPPVVLRNSDDFFPDVSAAHPWHIFANAYNALLNRHLNVVPDWDMFQTSHEYARFHAAARCVSGGPVYITDRPGKHDVELIKEMTGETVRGETVVLRPSSVARAGDPYVGYHDNVLLKVIGYHGNATGYPIMALFNTSPRPLSELISLTSFSGITPDTPHYYVVRAHTNGYLTGILTPDTPKSLMLMDLPVGGFEILTAYQLRFFEDSEGYQVGVAALGLLGKMTGAAAIVGDLIEQEANRRVLVDVFVKVLGVLGIFVSSLPDLTIANHLLVTIMGQVIPPRCVKVSPTDVRVLEIDVEAAWKEMNLRSGWANEVQVKVYINIG